VTETKVSEAGAAAVAAGWLEPAGRDGVFREQMWRLSSDGWRALADQDQPQGER
jgi:hypothetical protein